MYRALALVALLLLAACSSKKDVPITAANQAAIYFQEGETQFESGLYQDAIASWEKVRESFYSPELNTLAELKIAEAHFLAEDYLEASVAYEEFLKNYPDHARTPDVLYQLGVAYNNQMRKPDQDQTATRNALSTFRTLQTRFPDDPRNSEAQTYIDNSLNQLAASEVVVAKFYLKIGHYAAAINRIEGLFRQYPDYDGKDEAYLYLGQAFFKSGNRDKAIEAFNTLYNNYPGSAYVSDAEKFVRKHF
jgi:outer membrane protein assembly factor BamD